MAMRTARLRSVALAATLIVLVALGGCAPPERKSDTGAAATATSAADFGGMDALVAAAKAEGELNVIALPPGWANYGTIIARFSEKYGIKVNSTLPDANSQEEINAAVQLRGKSAAPDVFDLGQAVTLANVDKFAPYRVATFDDIMDKLKDPEGRWVADYGGFMSIGYDSAKVPAVTAVDDLLKPEFKGRVALNGDPTQAGAGFSGVLMAAVANGGSADDIAPGVDFFARLNAAGNFLPVDPTPATIEAGQTPVVIDWNYLNGEESKKLPSWRIFVPNDAAVAGYYFQAINADAPHPAAARLWQEFIFSDEGQNLLAHSGVRPVRADVMMMAGTLDRKAFETMVTIDGPITIPTQAQTDAAARYLVDNWAKAVG
ncbi:ABC transporter substrate-binding protein [Mycolicibacterium fallax]|nr:ABC transporter substrate-binding protein [Mycolicibacterium fallax]